MHILIIGNGFDLAHGLPTRYSDFMKQIQIGSDFHSKREVIGCAH